MVGLNNHNMVMETAGYVPELLTVAGGLDSARWWTYFAASAQTVENRKGCYLGVLFARAKSFAVKVKPFVGPLWLLAEIQRFYLRYGPGAGSVKNVYVLRQSIVRFYGNWNCGLVPWFPWSYTGVAYIFVESVPCAYSRNSVITSAIILSSMAHSTRCHTGCHFLGHWWLLLPVNLRGQ